MTLRRADRVGEQIFWPQLQFPFVISGANFQWFAADELPNRFIAIECAEEPCRSPQYFATFTKRTPGSNKGVASILIDDVIGSLDALGIPFAKLFKRQMWNLDHPMRLGLKLNAPPQVSVVIDYR